MEDAKDPPYFWCRTRVRWGCASPFVLVVLGLVVAAFYFLVVTKPVVDVTPLTPTTDRARPLMVALGDSFIAGEGTGAYLYGTAVNGVNTCHRSNSAHPYLVAQQLNYRLLMVACSGATTRDVTTVGQHPNSPPGVFGRKPQIDYLRDADALVGGAEDIDVVVLSIGGNDVNFNDIVNRCLEGNCIPMTKVWMREVDKLQPKLIETYRAINEVAPDARKIVMPYPDLIAPEPCKDWFSRAEVQWVRETFLPSLNLNIAQAANNAGWEVADDFDAFVGARLCEPRFRRSGRDRAVNRFKFDRLTEGGSPVEQLTRGSFHPNKVGHALLASVLLEHLAAPWSERQPCPAGMCPPSTLPPSPSSEPSQLPDGTLLLKPMPGGAACSGPGYVEQSNVAVVDERTVELQTTPNGPYCWREAGDGWRAGNADRSGRVTVDVHRLADQKALSIEVLSLGGDGNWHRTVFNATPSTDRADPDESSMLPELKIAAAVVLLILFGLLVLAIFPYFACWWHRRKVRRAETRHSN